VSNRNPRELREIRWDDPQDLSELRRHLREMHSPATGKGVPRRNADASWWHASQHQRYGTSHLHSDSELVLVTGRTNLTVERFLGWYTGQGAVTRQELSRRFSERTSQ
jgi:hypothetical protein